MSTHEKQVEVAHYTFERYSGLDRWVSYHSQLRETLKLQPESVLEIGVGDRVFGNYLTSNTSIRYESIDLDPELHPTHVGSITKLPVPSASFDAVVAFEVLEHIPFEQVPAALDELFRASKRFVVVSVPHFGPPIQFHFKIPFLPAISFAWKIPYPRPHRFDGQHYWELGKKGFPPARLRALFTERGVVRKEFVPYGNQYHRFFVVEKKP